MTLQKKPTRIHKTLANVVSHFEQSDPQHTFHLLKHNELPETIFVDEGRIVQMLENLLSNAVKYSPDGGRIELVAATGADQLQLSVIDRGIGMSESQIKRIFDKFYRANADNPAIQGLGLGMSVVKEIIDAHCGEITVRSVPEEGTTVSLFLPLSLSET